MWIVPGSATWMIAFGSEVWLHVQGGQCVLWNAASGHSLHSFLFLNRQYCHGALPNAHHARLNM